MNKYYLYKFWKDWPITQEYGWTSFALKMKKRYEETGKKLYRYFIHDGIDFGIPVGTKIKSPINGIIKMDDDINDSGRGLAVSVWDPNQLIGCRFYHLSKNIVNKEQKVKAGELICYSGKTAGRLDIGNTQHCHFMIVTTNENASAIGELGGSINPFNNNIIWLDNPADCV